MRAAGAMVVVVVAVLCACTPAFGFGGEDPLASGEEDGRGVRNWHHQTLTFDAARTAGFSEKSAYRIAWHADYIDSYLYNPLWWVKGGFKRANRSFAIGPDLTNLHFDDLTSTPQVQAMWDRITHGTITGLLWAQHVKDVEAARNILGISLHAVEDFYSHSNWIDDPGRRGRHWFTMPDGERADSTLYTGTYETPDHLGVHPHGKLQPACSILKRSVLKPLLEAGCSKYSPLSNTKVCELYKRCKQGKTVSGIKLDGLQVPKGFVYLAPPGMALDSQWMAPVGVRVRKLSLSPDDAFNAAFGHAKDAATAWLSRIDWAMERLGPEMKNFYEQVKGPALGSREAQYENLGQVPFQFMSAGPYPPSPNTGQQWYLRLKISTTSANGGGTDAPIDVVVDGRPFRLDYSPTQKVNRLLAYNDFEAGDNDTYTVGPFNEPPERIRFVNRAPNAGDVLLALGRSFVHKMGKAAEGVAGFFRSIVGFDADHVATRNLVFRWDQPDGGQHDLNAVGAGEREFNVRLNGGDEGDHRVVGSIRRTTSGTHSKIGEWDEFEVRLHRLETINESEFDRGSDSDEPFVLSVLKPLPGKLAKARSRVFSDVDDGESRALGMTFRRRIPRGSGMLNLALAVFESDDESSSARDRLLNKLAGESEAKKTEDSFLDALGGAIAADWGLGHVDAFAYNRAARGPVRFGQVLNADVNREVEEQEQVDLDLNISAIRGYQLTARELQAPPSGVSSPGFRYRPSAVNAVTPRLDPGCVLDNVFLSTAMR